MWTDVRSFTVHSDHLTSRSLFFKKALSGNWSEAQQRIIELPEDESDIFELYLQCVYGHEMSVEPAPVPKDYKGVEEQIEIAKLYVLAEKLQDVRAKNTALKAFMKSTWAERKTAQWFHPDPAVVHIIYDGTMPGSPMRRLLVDLHAYTVSIQPNVVAFPEEFYVELVREFTKARLENSFKDLHLKHKDGPDNYLESESENDRKRTEEGPGDTDRKK